MTVRVLHVLEAMNVGGAEQALLTTLAHTDRGRVEPLVCVVRAPGPWAGRVRDLGLELLQPARYGRLDPSLPVRLARLARDRNVDLIQGHLYTGNLWGRLAGLWTGLPCIATEQSVDFWKDPLRRATDRWLGRRADRVVCVARAVAEFYEHEVGVPGERITVIPNPFDPRPAPQAPEAWRNLAAGGPVIGFVGRLVDAKDPETLIAALAQATGRVPNSRAILVGDGPERSGMEARIRALGVGERIHLVGASDAAPALWSLADVGVLASVREGLPVSPMEAAAAGVPMVATAVGGTAEVVQHGRTGLMVPSRNPQALADALVRLLTRPERARAMGRAARALVQERFHARVVADRFAALYEEVLEGRAHRGDAEDAEEGKRLHGMARKEEVIL